MSKNLLGVSIIGAIVVLIMYFLHLHTIKWPAERTQNQHWSEQAETAPENFLLVCPPSHDGKPIAPEQCKRQGQYEYDRQQQIIDHKAQVSMRNAGWVTATFTGFGLLLVGITLGQAFKATDFARGALEEAKLATKAAQDTLHAGRAWMCFDTFLASGRYQKPSGETGYMLQYRLLNSGDSPARNLGTAATIEFAETHSKCCDLIDVKNIDFGPRFSLGPSLTTSGGHWEFPDELVDAMVAGETEAVMMVRAEYADIFEPNAVREMKVYRKVSFLKKTNPATGGIEVVFTGGSIPERSDKIT